MASLERNLRKDLEKTVKSARRVAEAGARKAVAQLGVGEAQAPKHLTGPQPALRNKLRAHGRQLGDRRDPKTGVQVTARLVQECAYEHWHRMLFARFLAETDLLIEPESGVAITLHEVQELAREKATDWLELASDYAERMLPQIFRKDDPVLQIDLPPETRSEMEDLLKGLSKEAFEADDSLGWVYQFWQAEKKDEVNKSETKIGADELPAVTQLFTEDYMVLFLLHNTLGAWWAGKVLAGNPSLAASAPDEAALRTACKVGDIDWTYLRFVRDTTEDGMEEPWRPAAGAFEGWPAAAKDLTVLDPCMGSGHFLVFALPILTALRMAEEGLSQSVAVDAVLKDNLFGLEIDPRCTQIAAFNLALAAWRKIGHRPLPQLNLACSGLAIGVTKAEWLKLAERVVTAADPAAKRDLLGVETNLLTAGLEERVKNGLSALYDLFSQAPWLGSLIDPRRTSPDIFREGFDKLEPLLSSIFSAAATDDAREMVVAAQGMAKAAEILAWQFTLVATNVPYLARGKYSDILSDHIERQFTSGKENLATAFVLRCNELCASGGTSALVSLQTWLFLTSYKQLRIDLLRTIMWKIVAGLGTQAFSTPMWDFHAMLITLTKFTPTTGSAIVGLDVSSAATPDSKALLLRSVELESADQLHQLGNPDAAVGFGIETGGKLLSKHASFANGIQTGDRPRFVVCFWEMEKVCRGWKPLQSTVKKTTTTGGLSFLMRWDEASQSIPDGFGSVVRGTAAWNKRGVCVSAMGDLPVAMYSGQLYDENCVVLLPKTTNDAAPIWAYCSSEQFETNVRKICKALKVRRHLIAVPFDLAHWQKIAVDAYPHGLPKLFSSDSTQWLFGGHPKGSDQPLHVATARMLGYRWPRQTGSSFPDCPALASDNLEELADDDGIVCLTALKGEPPAEQRLNALLAEVYGADWSAAKLAGLLADAGYAGKSLDEWLRDGFFTQHCELFQQRPFIWHIWDGRRDGFHALVNYHRLAAPNGEGRRTLEKLIYSYLGDWIDRQRAEQKAGAEGADARLAHAEHLKAEFIKILEGEPPYDIFVRWKPLHEQPLGWDPDINDGVRMNIRPFMIARPLNARVANACILRTTPKIKWDKDRGKESNREKADYPWFWGWDETTQDFAGAKDPDGNRWNDLHYSRAVKLAARNRRGTKAEGKK